MSRPGVVVSADAELCAAACAARLVTRVVDALAEGGQAHVVVTGGTVGTAALAAVAASPARDAVDWGRLHVWWGDERFVPSGSPDRNDGQARAALLDAVPLDPAHVHPMPAADGQDGDDLDAAAARYADELAAAAEAAGHGGGVPEFDVLMLGVGPDGHVASLFPGLPGVEETGRSVVAVRGSPKPPPERISLTLPAINRAREVWFVAAGEDKAPAVARALGGADPRDVPAAGARGIRATRWLLDRAAASRLPARHS